MKIACYSCKQRLDLTDLKPFSKIDCPICESTIIVPKIFGNILLEEEIGEGRLAKCYRAMDITLDREIVVKVLKTESLTPTLSKELLTEARSASAVNHPNIIPIYSCGEMNNTPYIIMQYMEGGSIKSKVAKGFKTSDYQLLKWFINIVHALKSATELGVIHYDIKPANIFLDIDGNIKIGDFSIARVLEKETPILKNDGTIENILIDNSYYISPEKIATGTHNLMAEIYALGATMYHIATGIPPFDFGSLEKNIKSRFEGGSIDLFKLNASVNKKLGELIMDMISIYPSDRPQNYSDLLMKLTIIKDDLKETGHATMPEFNDTDIHDITAIDKENNKNKVENKKSIKRVITVSEKKRTGKQYFVVKDFRYYSVRVIPILIILLNLILLISHFRGFPVYKKVIRPLGKMIKMDPGARDVINNDKKEPL